MFEVLSDNDPRQTVIKVVGVGGGGGNAVVRVVLNLLQLIRITRHCRTLAHTRLCRSARRV